MEEKCWLAQWCASNGIECDDEEEPETRKRLPPPRELQNRERIEWCLRHMSPSEVDESDRWTIVFWQYEGTTEWQVRRVRNEDDRMLEARDSISWWKYIRHGHGDKWLEEIPILEDDARHERGDWRG
jgi:hypothetical protein